jgi:hypothetical protein
MELLELKDAGIHQLADELFADQFARTRSVVNVIGGRTVTAIRVVSGGNGEKIVST